MTGKKSTKRALLMSGLALLMCFSMLIGSTYAWFTDSVTSGNNIIKSGNLDVEMYWADGDTDPATTDTWEDASEVAIFDYDLWEPGYVQARHLKISNVGTLALKYQLRILANGVVSELADVIDVYFFDSAVQVDRNTIANATPVGTLSEALNTPSASLFTQNVKGDLIAGASKTVTIALKMQESAGNEYQGLSIGTDFSVQLLATQFTSESDSFDNTYDQNADFESQEIPSAAVFALTGDELNISYNSWIGQPVSSMELDAGYSFQPTETYAQALASKYANAHADFYIYADNAVKENTLAVAGYYREWCQYNNDNWVALTAPDTPANTPIRLIADGMNNGVTDGGITVPYNAICQYGNDGVGFKCGIVDLDGSNAGTTVTVELRLYETYTEEECLELFCLKSTNKETGEYVTIGKFSFSFGGKYVTADNGAVYFVYDDGNQLLYDVANVQEETFEIPEGVTAIGDAAFGRNTTIKNVVFSDTVEEIGYQAFKNSGVESVVLNEGLVEIGEFAFNGAAELASFNIPSTVKTIGTRAFRSTAATEIVIPAGVESITEAFRDMPNLTTVTVEGNTHISDFSFRDCPSLRTVNLNGDDVVLEGGTTFCNASTNNSNVNNITFNVKNTTVADRIISVMGVGTNFYINVASGETYATVSSQEEMAQHIANGTDVVLLAKGTYDLQGCQKEGVSLIGIGAVQMANTTDFAGNGTLGAIWQTMTIKNVTFTTTVYTMGDGGKSTFDNVVFNKGVRRAYGSTATFNNCKFGSNSEGYALHFESDASSEGGVITLNSCEFKGGKVHLGGKRSYEFTNCNFASGTDFQVWSNISLENCTVGGVAITSANISTLFPDLNMEKVTLK